MHIGRINMNSEARVEFFVVAGHVHLVLVIDQLLNSIPKLLVLKINIASSIDSRFDFRMRANAKAGYASRNREVLADIRNILVDGLFLQAAEFIILKRIDEDSAALLSRPGA